MPSPYAPSTFMRLEHATELLFKLPLEVVIPPVNEVMLEMCVDELDLRTSFASSYVEQ